MSVEADELGVVAHALVDLGRALEVDADPAHGGIEAAKEVHGVALSAAEVHHAGRGRPLVAVEIASGVVVGDRLAAVIARDAAAEELSQVVAEHARSLASPGHAEGVGQGRANRDAMPELTAKRTLVKSPPELWSELSELERLARHLGAFGEIKITKLEPEHTVAWEGESASGTVSIEPSGWGTKVTLTAQLEDEEVAG